jgi:hypothetical protein
MKLFTLAFCTGLLLSCAESFGQTDVLTQHNNLNRTGWNNAETKLKTTNVNSGTFGHLYSYPVDDQVYAQPLIATQIIIPSVGVRNICYVATVNNSVYAYDADSSPVAGAYWHVNLTPSGARPPRNTDMTEACGAAYMDFSGQIGIVGTPVIDKKSGTLYLVSRSVSTDGNNTFITWLHALDITTGADKANSPVQISGTVAGTGDGSTGNGLVPFIPQHENQRGGLALNNGTVYVPFGSHCDWTPYHGWLFGYDSATLQQKYIYCSTPNGSSAGIWMSGGGPTIDSAGNVYVGTGNGDVGLNGNAQDPGNRGESCVRLVPSGNQLVVADYFTPYTWANLIDVDLDFGVTEMLLVPHSNMIIGGCKNGNIYVMNTQNLGGVGTTSDANLQTVSLGSAAYLRSSFSYYNGTEGEYLYTWSENTALKQFPIIRAGDSLAASQVISSGIEGSFANNGCNLSISSNGSIDSTAILWANHADNCDANHQLCPGIIQAISATNVNQLLWSSDQVPTDTVGTYAKFNNPTIANGKVYLGTFSGTVKVYGLLNGGVDTCNSDNIALNQPATASSVQAGNNVPPNYAFDGNTTTRWGSNFTSDSLYDDTAWIYVNLGAVYNLCRVTIYWEAAYGKDYNIEVSNDAINWTIIDSVRGNTDNGLQNPVINNLHGSGQYVRMQGVHRGSQFGYSIWEMQVYGTLAPTCFPPTSVTATNIGQNTVTIKWPAVADTNVTGYTIRYKNIEAGSYNIVTVPKTADSVNITALSCNTNYFYGVATNCSGNQTISAYDSTAFTTANCSGSCGLLLTRWSTLDLGAPGQAGEACYDGTTYTLKGAGNISANADNFRFAFTSLSGDAQFVTRVVTQDATDPANKVGLMIRDSLTPTSRHAFVGLTSGQGALFQYRSTPGGASTPANMSGIQAPYWVQLTKTGTVYTAAVSPDGLNWTRIGNPIDLGFPTNVANVAYAGLAITSNTTAALSTGTADNFQQSTPLPLTLTSFTGRDMGQYVALQWTTAMEQNVDHFEIDRSPDGANFTQLTTVKAVGNSNLPVNYNTNDNQPYNGLNYYRLKMVDVNGQFTYSPVILVRFGKTGAPLLFPNPTTSFFTIVAGQDPITEVDVIDPTGRKILQLMNGAASATLTVQSEGLARGVYFVQMTTASGGKYLQKIFKQ